MSLRIMFASSHCLLDNASGAALSVSSQLGQLSGLGWSCRAVTGTSLDTDARLNARAAMLSRGLKEIGNIGVHSILGARIEGVAHYVLPFGDTRRQFAAAGDEMALFSLVNQQIEDFKPDLLYIFGGLLLERAILREARKKGVRTLFYLANPNYSDISVFEDVSLILTPSQSLTDYYKENHKLDTYPIGTFALESCKANDRSAADCVTFINPAPEKGLTLFVQLARLLPHIKFLVIESRWTREKSSETLQIDWSTFANVEFMPRQKDMRRVYERTKLLIVPSFWFEAAGRVAIEAQLNGIPVIASSHGGIAEILGGAGFLFEVPERCRKNYHEMPDEDEIRPWVECISGLMTNPAAMSDAEAVSLKGAEVHDISIKAALLDSKLKAFCQ